MINPDAIAGMVVILLRQPKNTDAPEVLVHRSDPKLKWLITSSACVRALPRPPFILPL
jgi:hypothetical protein